MDKRKNKDLIDFYRTPKDAVIKLLTMESFNGSILEPSCGDGAISKLLPKRTVSQDLHDFGYGQPGKDFLMQTKKFDNIITNPPFTFAEEFIHQAIKLSNKKVALLLRFGFCSSQKRYKTLFQKTPPSRVLLFCGRLCMVQGYLKKEKGNQHIDYAWFIWDKAYRGPTVLKWIPGKNSREVA